MAGIVIEELRPDTAAPARIIGMTMRQRYAPTSLLPRAAAVAAAVTVALAVAVTGLLTCGPALAGKAHEHGAGKLNLVQEGAAYTLELELPLDTLVGFERAPRNAAERQAAQVALNRLRDAAALFRTQPASSGCTVSLKDVAAPLLEAPAVSAGPSAASTGANQKPAAKPAGTGAEAPDTHADATAIYSVQCPQQAAPQRLEVTLFEVFPRLKRLDVQTVLSAGQGRAKLSPSSRLLDLRR